MTRTPGTPNTRPVISLDTKIEQEQAFPSTPGRPIRSRQDSRVSSLSYHKPTAVDQTINVLDDEPILMSPALQHAMIESPREQALARAARSRSSSMALKTPDGHNKLCILDLTKRIEENLVTTTASSSDENMVDDDDESRRCVKFGGAVILDDTGTQAA